MNAGFQFLTASETPIALAVSIIALIFTALKDFILLLIFHPKIDLEGQNDEGCIRDIE